MRLRLFCFQESWQYTTSFCAGDAIEIVLIRNIMAHESNAKARSDNRGVDSFLPVDAPERRRLPHLLRRCWFNLNQTFRRRIAHTGVTPDQFTVMRTVLEGHSAGLT